MIKLAEKYIHDNNYFPNHEEFNDYYLSHPDYPSLYAVTDTLTFFGIENIAARVPIDQFEHLPDKFLTLFNTGKTNEFIYITSKNNASVSYLTEENKETTITKNQFLSNWKEITVAVDENENPVDNRVAGKNKLQWSLILFIGLALIIFSSIFMGWLWDTLAYSVLSLIGLGLSILILQENFGLSNEITSKICGATQTDKGACQSVLSSEGAKIYNSYTLSDACFILFGTLVVLNIFSSGNPLYFQIISISLFQLFFTPYGIKRSE